VRLPRECYPVLDAIRTHLAILPAAQQRGLAVWVTGTILAGSGCQSAVLAALQPLCGVRHRHALRQGLREWLRDGADKAAACHREVDVADCFAPLLGWVLAWWQGEELALALDATYLADRLVVVSVSVLYRGTAIPVAWHVTAANRQGAWLEPALELLSTLASAVPPTMQVLLLADRGLWSPRLWTHAQALGWHPLLRLRPDATFQPTGGPRVPARTLVPGPGHHFIEAGMAFKDRPRRQAGTLLVIWEAGQHEPWICLTDLPPEQVGADWYGLRTWIELGFRSLKSCGWHWERTRRTDPARVARHWLVLAVATLWTVAIGTRVEDATRRGREPTRIRQVLPPPPTGARRTISVFVQGLSWMRWLLLRHRRLWQLLWLWPEPWSAPQPPQTDAVPP
jgi:Transposase DDE domain